MSYKINDFFHTSLSPLVLLRMRYGWEGYGIYAALVSMLESQPDVTLPCDYEMLGFHLKIEKEKIRAIVEEFHLFEFESVGTTKRFFLQSMKEEAERRSRLSAKRAEAARKRWESKKKTSSASPIVASPSPAGCQVDLSRNPEAISRDREWLRKVGEKYRCPIEILLMLYSLFLKHISESRRGAYDTLRDAQSHFFRWLGKPYAIDKRQYFMREAERERSRRERAAHDANAITYTEYLRRKQAQEAVAVQSDR